MRINLVAFLLLGVVLSACVLNDGSKYGMSSQGISESKSDRLLEDQKYMCEAEIALACYQLAGTYRLGLNANANNERAQELLVKACELEHFQACSEAAYHYSNGNGIEVDQVKAIELFDKGCSGGISINCYRGGMLAVKYYQATDDEFGLVDKLFAGSCKMGNADGCALSQITSEYQAITEFRDFRYINKSMYNKENFYECFSGKYESCHIQAENYLKGKNTEANSDLAYELFVRGCLSGKLGKSCYFLAGFKATKGSESEIVKKSLNYLNLGCEFGDPQSCKTLSIAYISGKNGITINTDKAIHYGRKFCKYSGIKC